MRPAVADLVKQMDLQNRIGMRTVDVLDENLGGSALPDEEWDGHEGEGETENTRPCNLGLNHILLTRQDSRSSNIHPVAQADPR